MIHEACFDLMISTVGIIFVYYSSSCTFSKCVFCYTPGKQFCVEFVSFVSLCSSRWVDSWERGREGGREYRYAGRVGGLRIATGGGSSGFDVCCLRCTIRPLLLMAWPCFRCSEFNVILEVCMCFV